MEDAAVLASCLAENVNDPAVALERYESLRIARTARVQELSHGRSHLNHLPDGPEQQARDREFTTADLLVANGWIYEYDPEVAMAEALAGMRAGETR